MTDSSEGALCSATRRIMLISPTPNRIRNLLAVLTGHCFDVFTLHEWDDGMLDSLKPQLVIYDALPIASLPDAYNRWREQELQKASSRMNIPLLVLMPEREERSLENRAGVHVMRWPSEPEAALLEIKRIVERAQDVYASRRAGEGIMFKDLAIDPGKMIVTRGLEQIGLTKTEYDLLLHFITSDGSVQTREALLDIVWGQQFYASSNVVDVHIKSLRKKLKDNAVSPRYIATVRGAGYRLADR